MTPTIMKCVYLTVAASAWAFGLCDAFLSISQVFSSTTVSTNRSNIAAPKQNHVQHPFQNLLWWKHGVSSSGSVSLQTRKGAEYEDEPEKIPVLFESDRILIVNKPTGIAHHNEFQEEGQETSTSQLGIVNLLRRQRKEERLWGVHRLDRVTSGILILAKDLAMAQALTDCFAEGSIQKVYMGVSAKRPLKKKQGWIQGGMVRSRDKSWKLTRNDKKNFAKTRFFTAPFQHNNHKFTLILFRPFTGKTHQLRVAAKSVGLPLWGDPIYKDGSSSAASSLSSDDVESPDRIIPRRTYLHASGIVIPPLLDNPNSITVWCPPPFDEIFDLNTHPILAIMQKYCDVPTILQAVEQHGRR